VSTIFVECKKLHPNATIPKYQTDGAAGVDIHAVTLDMFASAGVDGVFRDNMGAVAIVLQPGAVAKVPTGLAFAIPAGFEGQLRPRSSTSAKGLLVHLGTIDSDYRGEVAIQVQNLTSAPVEIKNGDRLAQIVFAEVARATIQPVPELSKTQRGAGGFGSTGG
jgi:dUTP pyrophosphatase